MQYVIECQGSVYGPFVSDLDAAAWAHAHCAGRTWMCRPLREPAGGAG